MENYSLKDVVDAIYANREELDATLMVLNCHLERIAKALEERNKIEIAKDEILKAKGSMFFNLDGDGKTRERPPRKPGMRRKAIERDYIKEQGLMITKK